jgi:hypothetical protein
LKPNSGRTASNPTFHRKRNFAEKSLDAGEIAAAKTIRAQL